jgi:hypothetical protein
MGKVTKTEMMRNETSISTLSNVGKEAIKRDILEGEHRFRDNATENITGAHVVMIKIERVAMLLDLRTFGGPHVDKATYVMAKENLKNVYTKFILQCEKCHIRPGHPFLVPFPKKPGQEKRTNIKKPRQIPARERRGGITAVGLKAELCLRRFAFVSS